LRLPRGNRLARSAKQTGIDLDILRQATQSLVASAELMRETTLTPEPVLYLKKLYQAEVGVVDGLRTLCQGSPALPALDIEAALGWIEKKMALKLADTQREAIRQATTHKVLVITGGPGVGKTTLVRGILDIFLAKKLRCGLCAPTGRAAKRLAESTGQTAQTIHRLLEFEPRGPQRHADRPLELDLLIVDEMSMVDIVLMNQLLRALPASASLILVGDADQLPSVGPGSVLADIIASKAVPVVRLTEIFRQAQESGIVRAAYRIHDGELPESTPADKLGDFYFIEVDSPLVIVERIIALIRDRIPTRFGLDPFQDIQVLTPMNRGELGVKNLNAKLQAVLNPPEAQDGPEVARLGWAFRLGDKVLQTRNDYEKAVFNGDIGRVVKIDVEDQELTVDFDGRQVAYDFEELDELTLAYALTIHKSQGSEYPAVIVPLHNQHFLLLQRNLLYTAVTRGRKLVVVVGSRQALRLAVERHDTARRLTALKNRMQY
jgi:exodeoxyribonuclease V alpha subunit